MTQRLGTFGVLVAGLCLAAVAAASQLAPGVKAEITGSGTSYKLKLTATGDQPILCFGLLLDGVQPTAATGPPGVTTRVGTFQQKGLVHMQGTAASPVLRPGEMVTVDFQTNVPIPVNAGGETRYSATCQAGSDLIDRASGPPPPPPPPKPKPMPQKKCECDSVDVSTRNVFVGQYDWGMTLDWVLTCKGDTGVKCQGEIRDFGWVGNPQIEVLRPKAKKAKKGQPPNPVVVTCKGKCSKKPTKSSNRVSGSTKANTFRTRVRAGQGFTFSFSSFCADRLSGRYRVYVKFDAKGRLDKKASDLNGNGTIDSQEKKKK